MIVWFYAQVNFSTAPAAWKITACFKGGQKKRLKNSNLSLSKSILTLRGLGSMIL
jgi:hypothetical protein